jgi:hypothetical protein
MATAAATIIAFAGEDPRYLPIGSFAAAHALQSGSKLVLYDIDAAGLQAPLPTTWSAEGTQDVFASGRLTAEMLEGVGRAELARQVRHHEAAGVETYGWLPQCSSIDALADYAESQGAHLVVVPGHSDHRNLADFIRGRDTDGLGERTAIAVAVVGDDEEAEPGASPA